jgi:hypothetical protein
MHYYALKSAATIKMHYEKCRNHYNALLKCRNHYNALLKTRLK